MRYFGGSMSLQLRAKLLYQEQRGTYASALADQQAARPVSHATL
jgi:hypothetical protein